MLAALSKTNVAVYRQTDPASTRTYYRVDDTNGMYARVQMYESMTDVDNGIAVAPLTIAGGYYWHKRTGGATASYWAFAGDTRSLYLCLFPNQISAPASNGNSGGMSHVMGDLNNYRSGDAWCAVLTGTDSASYNNTSGCIFCAGGSSGLSLKRMAHGLGGAVQGSRKVLGAGISGSDGTLGNFPSEVDNSLQLSAILITNGGSASPRGTMPGAYHCPQSGVLAGYGWDVAITKGQGAFSGKKLLSLEVGAPASGNQGVAFIDITGPWRVLA